METKLILVALLAIATSGFQSLRADTMAGDIVTIRGSIIAETNTNGQTSILPITIKNVLGILGLSGTPSSLRYYYDTTVDSFVIAEKGIASGGTGTVIATVVAGGGSNVSWSTNRLSSYHAGNNDTMLDGDLIGGHVLQGVYLGRHIGVSSILFYGSGTISLPVIIKGTITDRYKEIIL